MDNPPKRSKALHRGLAIGVILLATGGAAWLVLDKLARLPGQVAGGVGTAAAESVRATILAVKEVMTVEPKVVSETTVINQAPQPAFELILAHSDKTVETNYESTWVGSTKVYRVRGKFRVKAGYKLNEENWRLDQRTDGSFAVRVPAPTVLACEQQHIQILEDSDGIWNKLSNEERSGVQNQLLMEARRQAATDELLQKVESELNERLTKAAQRHNLSQPPLLVPLSPAPTI